MLTGNFLNALKVFLLSNKSVRELCGDHRRGPHQRPRHLRHQADHDQAGGDAQQPIRRQPCII